MDSNKNGTNSLQTSDVKKGSAKYDKNVFSVALQPHVICSRIKKKKTNDKTVSYLQLFRYATGSDRLLLFMGVFGGILSGFIMPIVIVLYGEFTTLLIDRTIPNKTTVFPTVITAFLHGGRETDGTEEDKMNAIKEDSIVFGISFIIFSAINFLFSFIFVACLNYSALLQTAKLRRKVFESVLRQDMTWYDSNAVNIFPIKILEGLDKIQEGMGEKIGICINLLMAFVVSVTIALFYGWKLTLVMLTCAPVLSFSQAMVCKVQTTLKQKEMDAYGKAGSVAEEVFSSIKTVMAFNGQEKEMKRYNNELADSQKAGIRRGYLSGLGGGVMWFITYSVYALAFWYGVSLILESRLAGNFEYTPGILLITFFGVLVGAINLGQSLPHLEAFIAAKEAANSVFSILDRESKIDALASDGKTIPDFKGQITFNDVSFSYSTRPEVEVLKKVSFRVRSGEQIALVGASGCGKSTIMQLLQRFYDPTVGQVCFDDTDIKELNVHWLRQQLSIVGQEPSLFATTIEENIRHGLESATFEDVEKAAKLANAHDFIMKLPNGYQTVLGSKGSLISGGQKQRIAIARALIRNPKILLLDEATSALDAVSETKVQEALDKAAKGRTTLVVTHKLSGIKKSDRIIVLSDGQIVEEGNHEELIQREGHYFKLLELQKKNEETKDEFQETETENDESGPLDADYKEASKRMGDAEENNEPEKLKPASFFEILKYNKPEWWAITIGTLSTIIVGANVPVLSLLFGELYGVLSDTEVDCITSTTAYYSGLLLALGIIVGISTFLQSYMLNFASVKLTSRFRKLGFAAILNQEAAWFDEDSHQSGSLCTKLSSDASEIQGATGARIGVVVQSAATIGFGIVIGFVCSWKMTLVTLLCSPIIFFGMYYEAKIVEGQSVLEKNQLEEAACVAMEAITNIRTVASLGKEQFFLNKYDEILKKAEKGMKSKSKLRGAVFAIGMSSAYLGYALALWYGGFLVANGELHYKNVLKVSEAILFGVWILGQTLAFAPNFTQAKVSATRLFELIRRTPGLADGSTVKPENWKPDGRVRFDKVDFFYPTRPSVQVLNKLNLDISEGQSIALVGSSGCGKSTIIQLIQRLYDPYDGRVYLDDDDVSSLKIPTLRHQIGIVSQEPILFDRTIADNIAYGDNSRVVTVQEIISAAKRANIHDFIVSLPLGYETKVGSGGGQLSGGQKQRVAVARALIRNPKILLLDEATSALDAENESVVQATLDQASAGRTTITVGHRMSAIKTANVVYRLNKGSIQQITINKAASDQ